MSNESDILEPRNWLYVKLYRRFADDDSWKTPLDWYHNVVRGVIKPWVSTIPEIKLVFFGGYGPEDYEAEPVDYQRACKGILLRQSGEMGTSRPCIQAMGLDEQ